MLGFGRTLAALERRVEAIVGAPAVGLGALPAAARAPRAEDRLAQPALAAAGGGAVAGFAPPSRVAPLQVPLDVAVAWAAQDDGAGAPQSPRLRAPGRLAASRRPSGPTASRAPAP